MKNMQNINFLKKYGATLLDDDEQDVEEINNNNDDFLSKYGATVLDGQDDDVGLPTPTQSEQNIDANDRYADANPVLQTAAQFGRGMVGGVGDLVDFGGTVLGVGATGIEFAKQYVMDNVDAGIAIKQAWNEWGDKFNPHLGQKIRDKVDDLTDDYTKPTDTMGEIADFAGSILTPSRGLISIAKELGKGISKGVAKKTTKDLFEGATERIGVGLGEELSLHSLGGSVAVGAAVKGTEDLSFTDPNSLGRCMEDLAKAVVANKFGRGSVGSIENFIKDPTQKILKSKDANLSFLKFAEEEKIPLMFHHIKDGAITRSVANSVFEGYYASKIWNNALKETPRTLKERLKGIINWSDNNYDIHSEVDNFSVYFKDLINKNKEISTKLYDRVDTLVPPNAKVNASGILNALDEIIDMETRAPMGAMKIAIEKAKFMRNELIEFKGGQLYKDIYELESQYSPEIFASIKKQLGEPQISVHEARNQIKMINSFVGDDVGIKSRLSTINHAILDSLENSNYKELSNAIKTANTFYKTEVKKQIRVDLSESLINGRFPSFAYNKMNTVEGIKLLEKAIGTAEGGDSIMKNLKQAKLEEILRKRIFPSITTEVGGTKELDKEILNLGGVVNLFKDQKMKPLLEELMGKEAYADAGKIANITKRVQATQGEFKNLSGTGFNVKTMAAVASFTTFLTTGNPTAMITALGGIVGSKVLSSMLCTPTALKYAKNVMLKKSEAQESFEALGNLFEKTIFKLQVNSNNYVKLLIGKQMTSDDDVDYSSIPPINQEEGELSELQQRQQIIDDYNNQINGQNFYSQEEQDSMAKANLEEQLQAAQLGGDTQPDIEVPLNDMPSKEVPSGEVLPNMNNTTPQNIQQVNYEEQDSDEPQPTDEEDEGPVLSMEDDLTYDTEDVQKSQEEMFKKLPQIKEEEYETDIKQTKFNPQSLAEAKKIFGAKFKVADQKKKRQKTLLDI